MAIEATHKDIINLIMGDLTQFHIPIYQRTYTWDADNQVDKLLDDKRFTRIDSVIKKGRTSRKKACMAGYYGATFC